MLFRHTVEVADYDPPGMEFRVMRQLPWQDRPDHLGTTASKPEAQRWLKDARHYHELTYLRSRVWAEQRVVGNWTEVE